MTEVNYLANRFSTPMFAFLLLVLFTGRHIFLSGWNRVGLGFAD